MTEQRSSGITIGIVSNLDDDAGLGRVKVRFPKLNNQESNWMRLVTPMAGKGRGLFMRPEKDDEVIVVLEEGHINGSMYILGSVWSEADQPPDDDGNRVQNNWRFIRSRSGHIIKLDDTQGSETIEIIDKDGARKVIIDSAHQKIQVICDTGDVEVQAAKGTVKIDALNVEIKASKSMTLEAGGTMTITGATVNIN